MAQIESLFLSVCEDNRAIVNDYLLPKKDILQKRNDKFNIEDN